MWLQSIDIHAIAFIIIIVIIIVIVIVTVIMTTVIVSGYVAVIGLEGLIYILSSFFLNKSIKVYEQLNVINSVWPHFFSTVTNWRSRNSKPRGFPKKSKTQVVPRNSTSPFLSKRRRQSCPWRSTESGLFYWWPRTAIGFLAGHGRLGIEPVTLEVRRFWKHSVNHSSACSSTSK